jgi:simple sugar transport system substrate-binding protein
LPQVKSSITAKLQSDKSIDGILALNADIALTAADAAKDAGSSPKIATFDLNKQLIAALKDGRIQFAIDQQPYLQGYEAVDELWLFKRNGNILGGGRPVFTGPAIVDKTTATSIEQFAGQGTR